MAGYTPLFASLTTGTLCGKWPDIGLWPIVLSLADRYGIVDVTPDYLCRVTGLQIDAITACMQRFCEPDPFSRSQDAGGARLTLVDTARQWGWQVVNHRAYREKARKETYDAARVADGRNAERLKTRANPRSSAQNRADPPSDSNTNKDSNSEKSKNPPTLRSGGGGVRKSNLVPDEFTLTAEIREWSVTENPELDPETEFAKFHDHEFREPHSDWLRAWRRWVREGKKRGDFAKKPDPNVQLFAGKPVKWQ